MYYLYGPSLASKVKQHPGAVQVLRGLLDGFADWLEENPKPDPMTKVLINKVIDVTNIAARLTVYNLDSESYNKYMGNEDLSNHSNEYIDEKMD